jgi:hypothetical protein
MAAFTGPELHPISSAISTAVRPSLNCLRSHTSSIAMRRSSFPPPVRLRPTAQPVEDRAHHLAREKDWPFFHVRALRWQKREKDWCKPTSCKRRCSARNTITGESILHQRAHKRLRRPSWHSVPNLFRDLCRVAGELINLAFVVERHCAREFAPAQHPVEDVDAVAFNHRLGELNVTGRSDRRQRRVHVVRARLLAGALAEVRNKERLATAISPPFAVVIVRTGSDGAARHAGAARIAGAETPAGRLPKRAFVVTASSGSPAGFDVRPLPPP